MRPTRQTEAASRDLEDILRWTGEKFGPEALSRYEELFAQALEDLSENPFRVGCRKAGERFVIYHLRHSRDRVSDSRLRVGAPRHFILFRLLHEEIEVLRVLHDAMDLERHFPADEEQA